MVKQLATVQPVSVLGWENSLGGSGVWLRWVSGCLPGSVCSLAHLVLFILISCRHTAMSRHLINRAASIHEGSYLCPGKPCLVLD